MRVSRRWLSKANPIQPKPFIQKRKENENQHQPPPQLKPPGNLLTPNQNKPIKLPPETSRSQKSKDSRSAKPSNQSIVIYHLTIGETPRITKLIQVDPMSWPVQPKSSPPPWTVGKPLNLARSCPTLISAKVLALTPHDMRRAFVGGWRWNLKHIEGGGEDEFPEDIQLEDLLEGSQQLEDFAYAYPERNRVFGGKAHDDTVNYLYEELKKTGYYDVYKQPQVHLWSNADQTLKVGDEEIEAKTMTYSPSVEVTADVAVVKNLGCSEADYPSDVEGKVALIKRGECPFGDKSVLAAKAKAAASIVYNNVAGSMAGTLGAAQSDKGPYSAIVGISLEDGQKLIKLAEAGSVSVDLWVDSKQENRTTYNVVAQTKGGDPNNVVALGGHTDSVEAGPGINDDGSGIISNLVIAKALTQYSVKNAVRFLFWTAEEFGLLGSNYYVSHLNATELNKIRLYLNFDMIASPNYALMIYDGDGSAFNQSGPAGSAQIEKLFEDYYDSIDLPHIPTQFDGRSDYEAFILNGIPSGGLFTGAEGIMSEENASRWGGQAGVAYDANYHAAGDNMTNLNHEAFLINSKATAFAVATYANDLSSIPKRNTTSSLHRRARTMRPFGKRAPKTHAHVSGSGCWHSQVEA
ncbi:unnamed protein product [Aspergillus oryzae]|uniref:Peptide hydrolase n=1 Tax=Aspergillus oryzae TaxID=5062 RepID=A0AAN4YB65_ASPOZ|nr:unnamed protein product [Aspergillus oryzae]